MAWRSIIPALMGLRPSARLGNYEIGALLGAGGMGKVYRARDLSLQREIALRILPASYSRDAEGLRITPYILSELLEVAEPARCAADAVKGLK